ncbi:ABC-2 type transport system permease protein [Actinocorallia herbida]|uniref:ABC-2 type transport system permease protein n=1 Tax=Actinocorallia herbida TaxID=58109 RepID=A0A3N1CSW6_9ACTN|nr:ABC transporter permease [Actinocorallia herbida]ROO84315.1 ABC-2 type transport system permease protein [Actinocorallia herbida]
MNAFAEIRLVASRELARLRTRMFLIVTGGMMALIVGALIALKLLGGSPALAVGFADSATRAQVVGVTEAAGLEIEPRTVTDEAAGERLVSDGDLDALVLDGPLRLVVKDEPDDDLRGALTGLARQIALDAELTGAGLDPNAVAAAVGRADVEIVSLEGTDDLREQRIGLSVGLSLILFIVLQTTGVLVAQGVVEEKASRVVELLLSAVRPWRLMAGKVLGLGLVGLVQIGLVAAAGVTAQVATGVLGISLGALLGTAAWALLWFLVGYTIYALLYASAASTVARQEEIGGVTAPIQILLIIPYMAAFTVLPADPDGPAARVLSYIPFFAPILMPVRGAFGAPWWEQALALLPALLTIGALIWFSGRVYTYSVLRMGGRVSLKEALKGR